MLLFGSRDQIAARLAHLRGQQVPPDGNLDDEDQEKIRQAVSLDFELNWRDDDDLQATLHVLEPPELPERLGPGQAAQLAELLEYLHIRIRHLLASVKVDEGSQRVSLDQRQWQNLLDLQARLALYLRTIGDPG